MNYCLCYYSHLKCPSTQESTKKLACSLGGKSIRQKNDIVYNVEDVTKWLIFLTSFLFFLEQPKRSGRKQTTSMSSLINKKIRANDVSLPKPHPQVSSPPLSDLEQKIKLIKSKLDEGNVKGGIRLAASDDKIAPFSNDNYRKLLSKHPQRAKLAAPNPENWIFFS